MSYILKGTWNKYPSSCDTKDKKDAYRQLCSYMCPACKGNTVSHWNKPFYEMINDDGSVEVTHDDFYCNACGVTFQIEIKYSNLPQFDTLGQL
jgi:hypothetical protein